MAETTTKATPKKAATKTTVASAKPAAKKPAVAKAKVADTLSVAKKVTEKTAVVTPKPAAKKPAAPKKPAVVKKTDAAPVAKNSSKAMTISDEQRYRMVAEAAYYRAESNQFKSDPLRDWIEAESDIAALLSGTK